MTSATRQVLLFPKFLIVSGAAAALLLAACSPKKAVQKGGPPPAVPVVVATAARESVPVEVRVVGNVEPSQTVQVKSQVAGQLMSVHFTEGQNVNKGQLLFEIDPRPYQEALRQAQAAVERDKAQLVQAEANVGRDNAQLKFAEADAARAAALLKEGVIAKQQHDQTQTNAEVIKASIRADQAAIESMKATLTSDLAAVDRAKLDLSYCRIDAPVSGRTGNLLVHAGNLVKSNDVPLVVINQVTPVFVSFSAPEEHLAAIRARYSAGAKLPVEITPQDSPGGARSHAFLTLVDNTVDTATGTIKLKATAPNTDRQLWPGQFVHVVLTLDTQHDATVIPAEAVQAGQQGQFVYVVKPNKTVEPRLVTVGRAVDHRVIIDKGVAPGETVVTDGQMMLFPGAPVRAVPANQGAGGGAAPQSGAM